MFKLSVCARACVCACMRVYVFACIHVHGYKLLML